MESDNKNKNDKRKELRRLLSEAIQNNQHLNGECLNEDDLITDLDKEKKIVIKKDTPRRSCANCTCGKADLKIVKTSSCGNCYKGDLFRCQGCPSYGLPAYEPGDIVTFDEDE